jgi:hypothetical protein
MRVTTITLSQFISVILDLIDYFFLKLKEVTNVKNRKTTKENKVYIKQITTNKSFTIIISLNVCVLSFCVAEKF